MIHTPDEATFVILFFIIYILGPNSDEYCMKIWNMHKKSNVNSYSDVKLPNIGIVNM